MKKKIVPALVVLALVIVGAGGYFMGQRSNEPAIENPPAENSTSEAIPESAVTPSPTPEVPAETPVAPTEAPVDPTPTGPVTLPADPAPVEPVTPPVNPTPTVPVTPPVEPTPTPTLGNRVLRENSCRLSSFTANTTLAFGTPITREEIGSVTFLSSLEDMDVLH